MAVKTLSIPQELADFLEQNPDLSPSKILQSKIIEIKENRRLNQSEIQKLERRLKFMESKLWEANDRIVVLEKQVKNLKKELKDVQTKL